MGNMPNDKIKDESKGESKDIIEDEIKALINEYCKKNNDIDKNNLETSVKFIYDYNVNNNSKDPIDKDLINNHVATALKLYGYGFDQYQNDDKKLTIVVQFLNKINNVSNSMNQNMEQPTTKLRNSKLYQKTQPYRTRFEQEIVANYEVPEGSQTISPSTDKSRENAASNPSEESNGSKKKDYSHYVVFNAILDSMTDGDYKKKLEDLLAEINKLLEENDFTTTNYQTEPNAITDRLDNNSKNVADKINKTKLSDFPNKYGEEIENDLKNDKKNAIETPKLTNNETTMLNKGKDAALFEPNVTSKKTVGQIEDHIKDVNQKSIRTPIASTIDKPNKKTKKGIKGKIKSGWTSIKKIVSSSRKHQDNSNKVIISEITSPNEVYKLINGTKEEYKGMNIHAATTPHKNLKPIPIYNSTKVNINYYKDEKNNNYVEFKFPSRKESLDYNPPRKDNLNYNRPSDSVGTITNSSINLPVPNTNDNHTSTKTDQILDSLSKKEVGRGESFARYNPAPKNKLWFRDIWIEKKAKKNLDPLKKSL